MSLLSSCSPVSALQSWLYCSLYCIIRLVLVSLYLIHLIVTFQKSEMRCFDFVERWNCALPAVNCSRRLLAYFCGPGILNVISCRRSSCLSFLAVFLSGSVVACWDNHRIFCAMSRQIKPYWSEIRVKVVALWPEEVGGIFACGYRGSSGGFCIMANPLNYEPGALWSSLSRSCILWIFWYGPSCLTIVCLLWQ